MDSRGAGEVINGKYKVVQVQQKDAERIVYKVHSATGQP